MTANAPYQLHADHSAQIPSHPTPAGDAPTHNLSQTAIRYAVADSPLGAVMITASDRGIFAIELGDTPALLVEQLSQRFPTASLTEDAPGLSLWMESVLNHLSQPSASLDLPLDIQGTAYQRRVWQALQDIPAGTTLTYSQLAAHIGQPNAIRAVAAACAANRLALAIPCHRVVGKDGKPHGYRWGIARKQALLASEKV